MSGRAATLFNVLIPLRPEVTAKLMRRFQKSGVEIIYLLAITCREGKEEYRIFNFATTAPDIAKRCIDDLNEEEGALVYDYVLAPLYATRPLIRVRDIYGFLKEKSGQELISSVLSVSHNLSYLGVAFDPFDNVFDAVVERFLEIEKTKGRWDWIAHRIFQVGVLSISIKWNKGYIDKTLEPLYQFDSQIIPVAFLLAGCKQDRRVLIVVDEDDIAKCLEAYKQQIQKKEAFMRKYIAMEVEQDFSSKKEPKDLWNSLADLVDNIPSNGPLFEHMFTFPLDRLTGSTVYSKE